MHAQWERHLINLAGSEPHPSVRPIFSYWAGDHQLQSAYRHAAAVTRAHSKSFYLASALLPEEKRSAVRALYAFCRTVDDIVDESSDYDRELKLDYWRTVTKTASAPTGDRIALAWADTLARYHIPRHYPLQLIDGVARDLTQSRYQTFHELATYCYGVASTVGLMSMYIVGFKSNDAIPYAIKLGVALQMTNILRDVGEDFCNGRVYLPREDLLFHGISETDIELGKVTNRWRQFMKFQIDRTRQLYAESWEGVKMLNGEGQLAIGAASIFYQGILDEIEKNDYDVFTRRASLNGWQKLTRIPTLWVKMSSR
ncbi:MAG: phytoene/squalene synthase family protein [Chloroflexota bacterium]